MDIIRESDWKKYRRLQPIALERFCRRILDEVAEQSKSLSETAHESYLKLYRLIRDRDKDIDRIFGELKRSTAMLHLALIRVNDLLTDEEYLEFSEETRSRIEGLIEIFRGDSSGQDTQ